MTATRCPTCGAPRMPGIAVNCVDAWHIVDDERRDLTMAAGLSSAGEMTSFMQTLDAYERRLCVIALAFPEVAEGVSHARLRIANLRVKLHEIGDDLHRAVDRASREGP